MRIAIAAIAIAAVVAGVGGYLWVAKHERASQSSIVATVSDREGAGKVACVKRTSNGSVWWCAGVASGSGHCWVVHVPFFGSTKIRDGRNRCKRIGQLAAIAEQTA
jgi:hypothetical protein